MFYNPKYDWDIRLIFTSFSLYSNFNGIPDGKSTRSFCETDYYREKCIDVPYRKAYNPLSKGYDCGNEENWVEGEYSRIHRDLLIVNAMRNWMFPKKPNMTEEERTATIAEIEKLGERIRKGGSPKVEKAAVNWVLNGHIVLPKDNDKIWDAVRVCEQKHLNPLDYNDPNDILVEYKYRLQPGTNSESDIIIK